MLRVPKIVVLRFCVSYILLVSFLDVEIYLFSYSRVFSSSVRTTSIFLSFCEYIAGTRDFSLLFRAGPLGIKTRRMGGRQEQRKAKSVSIFTIGDKKERARE